MNTTTPTISPFQLKVPLPIAIGFSAASVIITITALIGNSLLILSILINENGKMKTTTNYLLINLAVSDMLTAIVVVPYRLFHYIFRYWILGGFLCVTTLPLEKICYSATTLTMMAMAIIRYRAVLHPLSTGVTFSRVMLCITGIWITSIAVAVPLIIHMPYHLMARNLIYSHKCEPVFRTLQANLNFAKIYYLSFNLGIFILPLILIATLYYKILRQLKRRINRKDLRVHYSASIYKSCRGINLMLITMVAVFTFCWAPYNVLISLNAFAYTSIAEMNATNLRTYLLFARIFIWLALLSSCLNPIICIVYNDKFRMAFKSIAYSCCPACFKISKRKWPINYSNSTTPRGTTYATSVGEMWHDLVQF